MRVPWAPPGPGVMGTLGSGRSSGQGEARGVPVPFVRGTRACLGSGAKLGGKGTNVCAGAQGLF